MIDINSGVVEQRAAEAFNKQSSIFDELYLSNIIIQYKRKRVREHVEKFLLPNSNILELNAGTGEDAIYFSQQGHRVHATDIAENMQQILKNKAIQNNVAELISTELRSFTDLKNLQNKGPYDFIFSNFAGLNCTDELGKVLSSFSYFLKPGGIITLVILPRFCLWETLLALKGNFKTAFRRFNSKNGRRAQVEGVEFTCWYYPPSFIVNSLKTEFNLLDIEGLCTFVPPSYLENFPKRYTGLYTKLILLENKFKSNWPWKNIGDYYVISFKKK